MQPLKDCFWGNGLIFPIFPCQGGRPSLTDDDIKRGTKKREIDELQNVGAEL